MTRHFQISYQTATPGRTTLTGTIVAYNTQGALEATTQFVRDNFLAIYEVCNPGLPPEVYRGSFTPAHYY